MILKLDAVRDRQRARVGGKAANLARLVLNGFPVPSGFCVTSAAFNMFRQACPRWEQLKGQMEQLSLGRLAEVTILSREINACLAGMAVPEPVQRAVAQACLDHSQDQAYAVRSSATVEDGRDHSFAGQFESFLNVRGQEALLEAIKACWLSLFSARALTYQLQQVLPPAKAAMAVVVQEMVPAQAAGVLFTLDPITGNHERIIIEATTGLGDRLVSGQVNPERLVVDKSSLKIIEHRVLHPPAILEKSVGHRLVELARKAERLFGGPQDLEWALAGNRVFLLQARPVTASPRHRTWEDRQVWTNINTGEVAPDVMTPMTWSLIRLFLGRIAESIFFLAGANLAQAPIVGLVAGRIYFNVNTALATMRPLPKSLRRIPNLAEALGGAQVVPDLKDQLRIPDEDLPDLGFRWFKYLVSWPKILRLLIAHSPRRGDAWSAQLKLSNDTLRREDFSSKSMPELRQRFANILREDFKGWDLLYLGTQAVALLPFQKACRDWLGDPKLTLGYRLFSALGGLPETESALALWRLAALAHEDRPTEEALLSESGWAQVQANLETTDHGRHFLADWQKFMTEHGHHCRGELELSNRRWSECPDYILGVVRNYLQGIDQAKPIENQRRLSQEREELTRQCLQRLRNPIKRWIFHRSLCRAQILAVNREEWKNQAVLRLTVLRRLLLALGERLRQTGVIEQEDDIFFLEMPEVDVVASGQAGFDIQYVIRQRRAEYEKNLILSPPPVVIGRFDPNARVALKIEANTKRLEGIPVFPGVVTGPARVILHTDESTQVQPGEILVAPFTDPAWTPYFLPAAGVVMDQGGILSHGSIVAREFGLPAVTNVGSATQIIRTGDLVQVNGTLGQVNLLEPETPKTQVFQESRLP